MALPPYTLPVTTGGDGKKRARKDQHEASINAVFDAVEVRLDNLDDDKLDGTVAALSDVVGSASAKATPVDADALPIRDSGAGGVLKLLTLAWLKEFLNSVYDKTSSVLQGAPTKATPVDADRVVILDSADEYLPKRLNWLSVRTALRDLFDVRYASKTLATDRLLGRDTAGTGDVEPITLVNGIGFTGSGQIGLTDMPQATFKGRAAGAGTGTPTDMTAAQAKAALALVKGDVGLAYAENTSDAEKPISNAQAEVNNAVSTRASNLEQVTNRTVTTVTGTGDAMVMTTVPPMTAYAAGQVIRARPPATNTVAGATMNVDGLGDATIVRADGTALRAGDLVGGQLYDFVRMGSGFRVTQNPQATFDILERAANRTVAAVGGTGNAMTVTTTPPMRSYADGQVINLRPPSTNTLAAVTINVDGIGVASVVGPDGNALRPGDLIGGVLYQLTKFGTAGFRVTAPSLGISVSRRRGPLLRDYKEARLDVSGRAIEGVHRNATKFIRGVEGSGSGGGGGGGYPRITFQHKIDGTIMPQADIDVGVFIYGQSYGIGYGDSEYYGASSPYNSTAIAGAFMPAPGSLPGDQPFSAYTGLLEQKYVSGYTATIETIASEMAKQLKAEWTAAGFTDHPRIIVGIGGNGGQNIQNLMRGSALYKQFLDIIQRCALVSAANGKRLVVYAIPFLQGEANRVSSESYFTTRAEYKAYILQLQRCLEADIRLITGQIEPVKLVLSMIARNNRPSEINAAQLDMALTNPDQVMIFDCCYAWEHGLQGSHPLVAGYRRGGYKAGRAIAGGVLGNKHRIHRVTRHWLQTETEFRFTTDLPIGATALVKDESGGLVPTTGMDAGAGWLFQDKDGAVPVSASAVVGTANRVGTGSVTFGRAVHESSLIGWYAMDGSLYPADSGNTQRPRGLFRANDGITLPDIAFPTHSFLLPAECN